MNGMNLFLKSIWPGRWRLTVKAKEDKEKRHKKGVINLAIKKESLNGYESFD